jgi:hypothetical protein
MQHRPLTRDRRIPDWGGRAGTGYLALSQRPLTILAFLIPLIVLYEYGSAVYLSDAAHGTLETIRAHSFLLGFFQDFGLAGRFLPALALISVLLVWHGLSHQPWKVRPTTPPLMAVESILWTIPLLVLILLVEQVLGRGATPTPAAEFAPAAIAARPWQARATIALGAGIYEEMVFRMIGMAALHLVFVDLARLTERAGRILAVIVAAGAFALYHDPSWSGGAVSASSAVPYFVAGCYFGAVYLQRGFGLAVGVHALYDILVLVILPGWRS